MAVDVLKKRLYSVWFGRLSHMHIAYLKNGFIRRQFVEPSIVSENEEIWSVSFSFE